jgi:DNA-binding NtrC family response regulator
VRPSVLVVDDDPRLCELLAVDLPRHGFACETATSAVGALERLERGDFDVVVTDKNMPGVDGIALCTRLSELRPDIPVVVMTAFGSIDAAIAAIRAGAYDFVAKPVETDALALVLERAARHRELERRVRALRRAVETTQRFDELIGESPPMRKLFDLLERLSASDASVLIVGESGTGKELVARALHRRGPRSACAFVAINSAAVPETLLESELFGHVRGAFTDAHGDRKGLIEQANGGTLLLDEIGEMPLAIQVKLLRVLEERRVRPVGGDQEIPVDVRIVSSTHRDLESEIEAGRFREDLYFRINVVRLELPPLRARGNDVLLIAEDMREKSAARAGKNVKAFARAAAEKLIGYNWPGNVRELRNCVEHAVALTLTDEIGVDDLPERIRAYRPAELVLAGHDPAELAPLDEVERRYILHVLEAVGGNRTLAARVLGLDRKTLYRKLTAYGRS